MSSEVTGRTIGRRSSSGVVAALLTTAVIFTAGSISARAETTPSEADTARTGSIEAATRNGSFLVGLGGDWTARGKVLTKIDKERPYNVKCDFAIDTTDTKFDVSGECGALFVKRALKIAIETQGSEVSGIYDAAMRTGVADITGTIDGDELALDVEWGGEVNGDTSAEMRIEMVGPDEIRIVTEDINLETGEPVVTSDLTLSRS